MKYLVIILVLLPTIAFSQIPTKEGKAHYERIDSALAFNKNQLYANGKLWFVNAFKDSKEVIQLDNKDEGELIGKGNFTFNIGVAPYRCAFTAAVSVRDSKYRARFYDFVVYAGTAQIQSPLEFYLDNAGKGYSKKILAQVSENMNNILLELSSAMKQSPDNF